MLLRVEEEREEDDGDQAAEIDCGVGPLSQFVDLEGKREKKGAQLELIQ